MKKKKYNVIDLFAGLDLIYKKPMNYLKAIGQKNQ